VAYRWAVIASQNLLKKTEKERKKNGKERKKRGKKGEKKVKVTKIKNI